MKYFIMTSLAISAIALIVPRTADAAALSINDATGPDGTLTFNVGQFDRGNGFVLDGTTLLPRGLGSASRAVSEGTPTTGPITHTFVGQFLTGGALVLPTSGTIAFTEAGGGISDILTYSYTSGAQNVATLTGSFVSDLEPGGSLAAPTGATFVSEGTPFDFSNTNITASAVSDVEAVPEPSSLPLLAAGLLGFFFIRYRRNAHRRDA